MVGTKLHSAITPLAVGLLLALPGALLSAGAAAAPKGVTFSKDVAPIFQAKCQSCHEPGSIAPMSLVTYEEVRPSAGKPMTLDIWAEDDALHSSGSGVPMTRNPPPVTLTFSKYCGVGEVTFGDGHVKLETLKGGKPDEPYAGKASTAVTFGQPGDYLLHVTANDYSGNGGGGSGCCWTTAIVRVAVKGISAVTTGQ